MTEIFKRKYGNSAGKLEDWIYQRSLTQFIPPRVGWDSFQPSANRDHPPWSFEAISPFLPPSLVSTTPELPWSSVARHLLAAAATSEHFSAYHTLSPRSSSHSLQWYSLTALSPLSVATAAFGWACDGTRVPPSPAAWSQGKGPGAGRALWEAFPLLLCFQGIVQAAHLFFWDISACSLQRLIFSGWFQKQWEMPMRSQCCKSTLKPSLDLEPGLARSAVKFSKGKRKKAISHHRSSGVFSMGTMMFWLSSKNFSNY